MVRKRFPTRLGKNSEAMIPAPIREKLGLAAGDWLDFVETDEGIRIEKARALRDDPFADFTEWNSDADDEAYANL